MVKISYEAYCCLPHWGLSKWPKWERKHWGGFHRLKPISPLASGRNKTISQDDENNFFSGQWYSEQRLKKDDVWRSRLNLWNVSNREQPVSDYDSRMQRETVRKQHRKWFGAHTGGRKRWLLQFARNLLCPVIRSRQTPTLKASKTQPQEIFLPDWMVNNNISQHEWRCKNIHWSHLCWLKYVPLTEAMSDRTMGKNCVIFFCNKLKVTNSIIITA